MRKGPSRRGERCEGEIRDQGLLGMERQAIIDGIASILSPVDLVAAK
jgi:hypothetical protein